jgi:NNP family nitrate/nitrite transporter-like MFS transporter
MVLTELQHEHAPPDSHARTEPAGRNGRWIDHWHPEDPDFWVRFGTRIARRNLAWSIVAEHIGFSVWLLWSAVVIYLPQAGFDFTVNPAVLARGAAQPGGRDAALPLHVCRAALRRPKLDHYQRPAAVDPTCLAYRVRGQTGTPYWMFLVAAGSAGLGGGNFASSMANISFFYPDSGKGLALGLNAAGGNIGVSSVQLIVPAIVGLAVFGSASGLHLENIALVWAPLSLVAAAGAYCFMDNLTEAKSSFREQVAVARQRQTWVMALLYVGTFGSFIGYSSALPLLMKTQFPDVQGVFYAFPRPRWSARRSARSAAGSPTGSVGPGSPPPYSSP